MEQNYINHIAFVIDKSGSIRNARLEKSIISVFDAQIDRLKERSGQLGQETRVSIYLFNQECKCLFYDIDVNKVPSLSKYYEANGDTALIDATLKVISDLAKTNTLYGDHAFLVYCLTDGENRINNHLAARLNKEINSLPDNWTVAALVPDQDGVFECKKFGFPANNIKVWQTTVKGTEEVGHAMTTATDSYLLGRSRGIRSTKQLFSLNTHKLSKSLVKNNLVELRTNQYQLLPVHSESPIRDYVESWTRDSYRPGSAYYLLTKPETIQFHKQIAIQDKSNGKIYTGTNARQLLGLPEFEVKVNPVAYGNYDIFIQSTSVNRKLVRGSKLLVLK